MSERAPRRCSSLVGARRRPWTDISGTPVHGYYFLGSAGMYAVFQGMQQIILPTQIAAIEPERKVIA